MYTEGALAIAESLPLSKLKSLVIVGILDMHSKTCRIVNVRRYIHRRSRSDSNLSTSSIGLPHVRMGFNTYLMGLEIAIAANIA